MDTTSSASCQEADTLKIIRSQFNKILYAALQAIMAQAKASKIQKFNNQTVISVNLIYVYNLKNSRYRHLFGYRDNKMFSYRDNSVIAIEVKIRSIMGVSVTLISEQSFVRYWIIIIVFDNYQIYIIVIVYGLDQTKFWILAITLHQIFDGCIYQIFDGCISEMRIRKTKNICKNEVLPIPNT